MLNLDKPQQMNNCQLRCCWKNRTQLFWRNIGKNNVIKAKKSQYNRHFLIFWTTLISIPGRKNRTFKYTGLHPKTKHCRASWKIQTATYGKMSCWTSRFSNDNETLRHFQSIKNQTQGTKSFIYHKKAFTGKSLSMS